MPARAANSAMLSALCRPGRLFIMARTWSGSAPTTISIAPVDWLSAASSKIVQKVWSVIFVSARSFSSIEGSSSATQRRPSTLT